MTERTGFSVPKKRKKANERKNKMNTIREAYISTTEKKLKRTDTRKEKLWKEAGKCINRNKKDETADLPMYPNGFVIMNTLPGSLNVTTAKRLTFSETWKSQQRKTLKIRKVLNRMEPIEKTQTQ